MFFFCRYTKEVQTKRKIAFSYEVDPSVTMFSATWYRKNLFALHKAWFVNLSARLVSVDLSDNHIEELPDELFNTLPLLEVLDVSKNKLQYLPEVASEFTRYSIESFPLSLIVFFSWSVTMWNPLILSSFNSVQSLHSPYSITVSADTQVMSLLSMMLNQILCNSWAYEIWEDQFLIHVDVRA